MINIPIEKFKFASRDDLYHDSKFETKPVSYFQGAFQRFSKNKGAVVGGVIIAVLVLFAILAPFFTPFTPAYYDMVYAYAYPRLSLFADSDINFWDGCKQKDTNYVGYLKPAAAPINVEEPVELIPVTEEVKVEAVEVSNDKIEQNNE